MDSNLRPFFFPSLKDLTVSYSTQTPSLQRSKDSGKRVGLGVFKRMDGWIGLVQCLSKHRPFTYQIYFGQNPAHRLKIGPGLVNLLLPSLMGFLKMGQTHSVTRLVPNVSRLTPKLLKGTWTWTHPRDGNCTHSKYNLDPDPDTNRGPALLIQTWSCPTITN